jgi:tetratricopeptide (TPR) repeat protein
MAQAYYMNSDLKLAQKTIARAAALAPDNPDVCQKYGEYLTETLETRKEGLQWLEKARSLKPSLEQIDFDIALAQFHLKNLQGAAAGFEAALKKDPANGEAAFFLGESWSMLGDWKKARDNYDYAFSHGYSSALAYFGLGRSLVQLGSYEAALAPLQHALDLEPSLIQAHFQLAQAYRQLGRLDDAQRETNLYGELSAAEGKVSSYTPKGTDEEKPALAYVKSLLAANKEQEALDYLTKQQSKFPALNQNPYYQVGILYHSLGRNDDAKRVLEIARARAPKDAKILAYLAVVLVSLDKLGQAEEYLDSALALDPANEFALINLAGVRYRQQRWEDVIMYLQRSHTANPGALYMLCDSYFKVGNPQQAMGTAEAIRSLAANNKGLLDDLNRLVIQHQADQPVSPAAK